MGSTIEFSRPDGKGAPGYLAEADARNAPGVVMLEEWWGVNDEIKATADRLAGEGFRVLVPDLFRGRVAATGDEANHMAQGLDFADAASQDAAGAAAFLSKGGTKTAVTGYCMGGALAMLAAMHSKAFHSAVVYYGYPPPQAGDPATIRIPFMGHWAIHDEFFKIEGVDAIEEKLKVAKAPYEFYRYDAKHAFANPKGLGNYDSNAAETAWRRSVGFFHRTLG
ncbi:MAG: dienelactone hydrolase family protein [Candidatus Tyrphobacter sp.]